MVRRRKPRAVNIAILCVDRVVPTGAFTSPAPGNVSGVVAVTVTAADNDAVASVQFQVDGSNIGGPDTASPYTVNYDTRNLLNGGHTFSAIITDRVGNTLVLTRAVTFANAPVVTITSPGNGSTFGGGFAFTATITSYDAGCNSSFQIDGGQYDGLQGQGAGTVSLGWGSIDSMPYSNAAHTFSVISTDSHGNSGSASIVATIRNTPPPIPPVPGPTGTLGDWVENVDDPNSWDQGGAWFGGFGGLSNFALWTAKGFTLQVRTYMNYHVDSKQAISRVVLNDGGGNYWPTGPQWGGNYAGDYVSYSGWINVPNFGWGQIRARMDVTREAGGDYYVHYNYTQVEFNWSG
jgi:Bacterial Ig domain